MTEDEPNIVTSGKSLAVLIDGVRLRIEIDRLEADPSRTMEAVDMGGTSHVWEGYFASDTDARNVAVKAIEAEGAIAFVRGDKVVRFRPS